MNIYFCCREFAGYNLTAVVFAENEKSACSLLAWEFDEDTTKIEIKKIGVSDATVKCILCEEFL